MEDEKIYGVIVEWKLEQPLIMESTPMTYQQASERMSNLAAQSNVIRAAMFKAVYVNGNETLIPKETI